MNKSPNLLFFSYKSAWIFFSCILILNLFVVPFLTYIGVNQQVALFLINTLGISASLTYVVVRVEGKLIKHKHKHSFSLFMSLLIVSSIVCSILVFQ
ncbi:hypothetical protein CEQ21_00305 [Niallia circulans]|uniref:Uncharacterized protein n=1 Tax=Niallia circulans TaxID=1397 RepID=A0A553SR41_NIACI|nr:hypothetical protein CEQ21_00305 [Niallia circulans]